jgi:hypothetical protein
MFINQTPLESFFELKELTKNLKEKIVELENKAVKKLFNVCAENSAVIVPVKVYSDYKDGNLSEELCIGTKYAVFYFDNAAVAPDYWFQIDEGYMRKCINGEYEATDGLYETPEAALEAIKRGDNG